MANEKSPTVRVCITLSQGMVDEYRELAHIVNRPTSWLIRRRLEVRGAIIAVPESMEERMAQIYGLFEQIKECGRCPQELTALLEERVRQCASLVDFKSPAAFIHYNRKNRRTQHKSKPSQGLEGGAALC